MGPVELDRGRAAAGSVFDLLRGGEIVVIRSMPEIHELGAKLQHLAEYFGGNSGEIKGLMRNGTVGSIETLAAFHAAFRHLRDSRYLSCLFSDVIGSFKLPEPVLVDTGFCRMVVPDIIGEAAARADLFCPSDFEGIGPGESEPMLQGGAIGNPHRDLDARHYHFQFNFWFPLHDLDERRSLVLFPDAYHADAPQYTKTNGDPDQWGFGHALQVPLRFGDMLVFHSQHLHASPPHAPGQNRFTVELRVAAGCIDDNARIYRRLFWSIGNFRATKGTSVPAQQRAAPLAAPAPGSGAGSVATAETAHVAVHRLFRHAGAGLSAGYVRRPAEIFDDAVTLDSDAADRLIATLDAFPCGEDLWLLVARLLSRQGHVREAVAVLDRVWGRTSSYFWALETGRIAAEIGAYDTAHAAFVLAERLARESDVTIDRYVSNPPPPRIPGWVPQLLPVAARRVAQILARRARAPKAKRGARSTPLDYQTLLRPLWKRVAARLLRSNRPHGGLLPVIVKWVWWLRSAQRRVRSAMPRP